jgi:succinate dehydrogenase (ubiquinone) iron-sulfur subunit
MLRTLRLSKRFISLNSTQRMNHTESVKKAENAQIAKGLTTKRIEFNQPDPKKFEKRFDVYRFDPDTQTSHYKSYYIDLTACGPMILDALIKIKDEMDPTLSFRRSCREGICGSCSMSVDGRNTLACLSYIDKDKSYPCVVAPLPFFTVIRDLVVDMTNFYTQYKSINPYLQRKTPKVNFKDN